MIELTDLEMNTCFQVKIGGSLGTAFLRGSGTKTYFVTAAHVIGSLKSGDIIQLHFQKGWKDIEVETAAKNSDGYDVAVFTTKGPKSMPINFSNELPALFIGSELKFLGYPHGLTNSYPSQTGFSTPFVRTAFFSGLYEENGHEYLVLDGFNNPGYSGGPIYGLSKSGKPVLVGVVSGYRIEHVSHSGVFQLDATGNEMRLNEIYIKPNSGMVLATALGKFSDFLAQITDFNISS